MEVDDQEGAAPTASLAGAGLDGPADAIGRPEEEESLEADDEDGLAVLAQDVATLLGSLDGALVVAPGQRMPDAVDPPVFEEKERDGSDEADGNARGEADEDDEAEDQEDD